MPFSSGAEWFLLFLQNKQKSLHPSYFCGHFSSLIHPGIVKGTQNCRRGAFSSQPRTQSPDSVLPPTTLAICIERAPHSRRPPLVLTQKGKSIAQDLLSPLAWLFPAPQWDKPSLFFFFFFTLRVSSSSNSQRTLEIFLYLYPHVIMMMMVVVIVISSHCHKIMLKPLAILAVFIFLRKTPKIHK